jgi:hypothetical protein
VVASSGRSLIWLTGCAIAIPWVRGQATTFVLTGLTPWLYPVRATIDHRSPWQATTSINLEVSMWTSAGEVTAVYRRAQGKALGPVRRRNDSAAEPAGRRRSRALTSEHRAELAVFVEQVNDGRSWSEAMREWNETPAGSRHPYFDLRKFIRDAHEVYRQVTDLSVRWAEAQRGSGSAPGNGGADPSGPSDLWADPDGVA